MPCEKRARVCVHDNFISGVGEVSVRGADCTRAIPYLERKVAVQIARGMAYLERKVVVYRNLATRNCMPAPAPHDGAVLGVCLYCVRCGPCALCCVTCLVAILQFANVLRYVRRELNPF